MSIPLSRRAMTQFAKSAQPAHSLNSERQTIDKSLGGSIGAKGRFVAETVFSQRCCRHSDAVERGVYP